MRRKVRGYGVRLHFLVRKLRVSEANVAILKGSCVRSVPVLTWRGVLERLKQALESWWLPEIRPEGEMRQKHVKTRANARQGSKTRVFRAPESTFGPCC